MDIIVKEKEQPFDAGCENMSGMIRRVLVHHEGKFYIVSENTVMEAVSYTHLTLPTTPYV